MADVSQIKLPNGTIYDLIDEKSGYITAQYIENKTDYEIPVSRVGEIVAGETAIGTDSTNFPTSKAVVDYVDERIGQEIDAINVGVTEIKANGVSLPINNGIVNIPEANLQTGQAGLFTQQIATSFGEYIEEVRNDIPTSISQLTNDSGFITANQDVNVKQVQLTGNKIRPILLAASNNESEEISYVYKTTSFSYTCSSDRLNVGNIQVGSLTQPGKIMSGGASLVGLSSGTEYIITLPNKTGTMALTSDIPTVPTNISAFTNDSGYLTASDIASVMIYKGTKANYAALPSTGNTIGDVWHLTDTGAEWAWDGSAWQELGTAIDLSNYAAKATTLSGYGITDAKIQNGTITLGSNTITPLTSFTETDPTVPSWAKQSSKPTYTAAEVGALPDSTTIPSKVSDLTNDSGFISSYTETDPVFSASAAAGITATDINNWNGKSDTDEKVMVASRTGGGDVYIAFSSGIPNAATTLMADSSAQLYIASSTSSSTNTILKLGNSLTATATGKKKGAIRLYGNNSNYIQLEVGNITDNRTITFPDKAGTVALTSDIPTVYSSTNTGGYLTMATLPIYNGTVV